MTDPNLCPTCGCELPADAGLCPECLLRQGFAENDSLAVEVGEDAADGSGLPVTTPPVRFNPPSVEELASLFPGLEIVSLLGHGGMGAVYQARQTKLDRLVALKIIRPESAGDPAFAERFLREARTLARLSHPHIVGVHDFGEVQTASKSDEGSPATLFYFVMEYVDGANLRQLIEAGELAPETAIGIVPQLCEALQFAHDQGVVHRDIKPENILVDSRGQVKIADFGLARLTEASPRDFTLTATHQVMGTPRYMAPEQMEGSHKVDHRADIYSLGVVFYEMLTGQVPAGHFDPPSKKVQIDVRLDEVVLRSLAREPERRYQQASEVKTDVEVISLSSGSDAARTVPGHARQHVGAGDRQNATAAPVADVTARLVRQVHKVASSLFWLAVTEWVLVTLTLLIGTAVIYVWDGAPSEWKKALRDDDWTGGIIAIEFWTTLHAVIVITSSLLLKRLQWWWLGVASAVLVMLFPPANLAGLPIGIWSLVVLSSRDVRKLFESVRSGDVQPDLLTDEPQDSQEKFSPSPRFSGTVIGGFVVFLMLLVPSLALGYWWLDPGFTPLNWPWPWLCFSLGGCLLTVFGMAAIGEIRKSDGKITGLGVATAEALAFPLLLLNGAIFGVLLYFNYAGLGMNFAMSLGLAVGETALMGGWASSEIIRRIWSAVCGQSTTVEVTADSDEKGGVTFPWRAFWFEFSILAALFGIVGFTQGWTAHGGALAALALPWLFVGGCRAYFRDKPEVASANVNLVVAIVVSVILIAGGVVIDGTPVPLWGFGACLAGFLIGTGAGTANREAEKSRKAAEEYVRAHADDPDEESSDAGLGELSDSQHSTSRFPWAVLLIEFLILTAVFGLITFSMQWQQSGTALWMLSISWMIIAGFGIYHDDTPASRATTVNALYGILWSVGLLGYGVALGGLHTISGIVSAFIGLVVGLGIGGGIRATDQSDSTDGDGPDMKLTEAPATVVERGALGQAWDAWWHRRDPWVAKVAQTVLSIAFVVCLILYLSFQNTSTLKTAEDGRQYRHTTITYGSPGPWFEYDAYPKPNTPFEWEIRYTSSSMGLMLLGFLLYCVSWEIEKARAPLTGKKLRWLGSPASVATFWVAASVVGIAVAMAQPSLLARVYDGSLEQTQRGSGEGEAKGEPANGADSAGTAQSLSRLVELTGIHHAASVGDLVAIRQLLQQDGVDVNQKNPLGMTPLMYAAKEGHISTTLALIVLGANINEIDNSGQNAVMHATAGGQADVIRALRDLENFAASCHRDKATPDQAAERFKEFPGLDRRLLEELSPRALQFKVPFDAADNQGETAFMKLMAAGDRPCYDAFSAIGKTTDGTTQNRSGQTAQMLALVNGHTELLHKNLESQFLYLYLVPASVGLHLTDNQGRTLLALADELQHKDTAERIRSWLISRIAAFTQAIEAGRPNTHELFSITYLHRSQMYRALGETEKADADLAASEDSKLRAANHVAFFRAAVAEGDVERAKSLIASLHVRLDVNGVDADGRTALMAAASAGHEKMVALLMALGALPDIQDKTGQTALMLAAQNAHNKTVEMILRVCLVSNRKSDSTLYRKELEELAGVPLSQDGTSLKSLIDGAIPFNENLQDVNGETALMKAARVGDVESIRQLTGAIAGGLVRSFPSSDPTLQDKQGRTAFMHAVVAGQMELVQDACRIDSTFPAQFRFALPDFCSPWVLSKRDADGKTALQLADEARRDEIAAVIRKACDETIRRMTTWSIDGGKPDQLNEHIPLFHRAECLEALGDAEEAAKMRLWFDWLKDSGNNKRNGLIVSLMEAAKAGNADRVKAVLLPTGDSGGLDPNSTGPDGETALMKAAAAGQARVAVVLLLRGANEQARDKLGQTALMHAAGAGRSDIVKLMYDFEKINYDEPTQFRITRLDSDLPVNIDLSKMRFDFGPKLQDENGETALMKAAAAGNADCVLALMSVFYSGAAELKDKSGRTALVHAVEAGHEELLSTVAANRSPGVVTGVSYEWATFSRSNFFYPDQSFGVAAVDEATVVRYLETSGLQAPADVLRKQIQQMIDQCTKTIDKPEKPRHAVEALQFRASLWRELGKIENAESDEKSAERLGKEVEGISE